MSLESFHTTTTAFHGSGVRGAYFRVAHQLYERRCGPVHGVEDDQISRAIATALQTNNRHGVAWLLKIDRRHDRPVDLALAFDVAISIQRIASEVRLDCIEKDLISLAAVFSIVTAVRHARYLIAVEQRGNL